ncbi:MAG TPA: error-prone DNA polymerase, partial [Burkholderiaceae bacterium]|nr:error-prone DNA polymerase [Burkholderiaceae bacterium]
MSSLGSYAELHCLTNFSFLQGASHPEELVARAQELDYTALAITDECSLAGAVRAHLQARSASMPILVGAQFSLRDALPQASASRLVLLARDRAGYGRLSQLITTARMRADKGQYRLLREDLDGGVDGCLALWVPDAGVDPDDLAAQARFFADRFAGNAWIAAELLSRGTDAAWLELLRAVQRRCGLPLVAASDVRFHVRSRKALNDVLAAIRLNEPLHALGLALPANAEQHLRSRLRLAHIYPPELLEQTLEVASRCRFSLDELRYEYPEEIVPAGETPTSWLRSLTYRGAQIRYPHGLPPKVRNQIEHELALIADLKYEPYFLTVADLVHYARSQDILCQGRGSAANSAVCYCLGVTEVDPARLSVLFERFLSKERNEPPDIDIDFEHQRREEVIQYIYRKYGRDRAALTATVITYRPRSAIRDVGKALGIDADRIDRFAKDMNWWDGRRIGDRRLADSGFDPGSAIVQHWVELTHALIGFPRHLSQHSGGFVIARDSLSRLVPIENAAMPERSVIQWDKDDLDALGLLKIDVLALGMLTAIRRALALIAGRRGLESAGGTGAAPAFRLQDIPSEDPETYEMLCRADSVGVFQVESRAQMSMLPRLQPRCFYDLVIQVAIVRPGPIQGGMVHPYLRRRQGLEPIEYPRDEIRPALERTLGVPIFQEQVMQIAMLAAGFTPGEADQLRRAMAAWRRKGTLQRFGEKLVAGMLERGYKREFADAIFRQVEGFGEYGFPESHAASFALLVYVSSWIKRHEPAAFVAAMLNSQPMGFYAPAQLVRDAREHGVQIRPVDVRVSDWDCTLEETTASPPQIEGGIDYRPQPAMRLGLNRVSGLGEAAAKRLIAERTRRQQSDAAAMPFTDVEDLARSVSLTQRDLQALAHAGALAGLSGHRTNAAWQVAAIQPLPPLLACTR